MPTQQPFDENPSVHEMLGDVISGMAPLAQTLQASVGPIRQQRDTIRSVLEANSFIRHLPGERPYMSLAAVDGAYTLTPLFIGDQINVLALAVRSDLDTGDMDILSHEASSTFLPHSPTSESLAKTQMLTAELRLLQNLEGKADTLGIIDGSHLTVMITIAAALAEPGSKAYDLIRDQVMSGDLISAIQFMARDPQVVACPKSDSSTELAAFVEEQTGQSTMHLPDKVLASLVLEPGEVLTFPGSTPPWTRYDMMRSNITSYEGKGIRDRLDEAIEPLRTQGIQVVHIKPVDSSTAIRVETKGSVSDFEALDYWQALADDCAPPHTQEPVAQYVADLLAKNVSVTANVQLDSARLDLAEVDDDGAIAEFLIRGYRTT